MTFNVIQLWMVETAHEQGEINNISEPILIQGEINTVEIQVEIDYINRILHKVK